MDLHRVSRFELQDVGTAKSLYWSWLCPVDFAYQSCLPSDKLSHAAKGSCLPLAFAKLHSDEYSFILYAGLIGFQGSYAGWGKYSSGTYVKNSVVEIAFNRIADDATF